MAIINLRVSEEMKRKLTDLAKATGSSQTELMKNALAEKLTVHETADIQSSATIPSWVPDGKYVALVRGAVAAVGDSVADVSSAAVVEFPNEPVRVVRKGKRIKPIHYAFVAEAGLKCWKYEIVDEDFYPVIPAAIIGNKKVQTVCSPDTASSLTLVNHQLVDEAGLQQVATETVATAAGSVRMDTFKATIELPVGRYDAMVASSEIPKALPFQVLLGRNILDGVDLYTLGKSKVLCLKDP
jgi:predicted transcriptional regulator/predicted aspartyl protease